MRGGAAPLFVMPPAEYAARPVAGRLPWSRAAAIAAAGAVGFILDLALSAAVPVLWVPPSCATVLAAWVAAASGPLPGVIGGAALGLALDVVLGGPFVSAGSWATAGFVAGYVGRRLGAERVAVRPAAVAAASTAAGLLGLVLAAVAAVPPAPLFAVVARAGADALLAGAAALLVVAARRRA